MKTTTIKPAASGIGAAVIARATRPDQQVVACAIGDLPARLAQAALPGPVLVMIGRAMESLGDRQAQRLAGTA